MTQDDGGYDLSPAPESGAGGTGDEGGEAKKPLPGEAGWVAPEVVIEKAEGAEEEVGVDPDVEMHKGVAVAGYLFFLIPLMVAPNSKFARYHANQGLIAFILFFVAVILVVMLQVGKMAADRFLTQIAILQWFFSCGFTLLQPAILVGWVALVVMGIIHAANGESRPLPGVGQFRLIK